MTDSLLLHPALPFAVAAALVPWVGEAVRRALSLVAPLAALWLLALAPDGAVEAIPLLGHEWVLLRADGLARIFAYAFVLYALMAGLFAWTDRGAGPRAASLGLSGAGVGVVLAGDLLTLFFFWEWLTVTSLFLIWFGRTRGAWDAGFRYLLLHLAGATAMLVGILWRLAEGDGAFGLIGTDHPSGWLILAGMVTNAAVPPLHAWLSDAYPQASVYGTVFLSAFTTKAAVYALARGFPGTELLVWAGAVMTLYGVFYAVLENNIRRLLSYHIVSQVGYMVTGVGLGSALALNGSSAHAFSHIFYKGLLMMSAGAVVYATGRAKLSELGQLAGPLRWTLVAMTIGAFSISGVPLLNGFVSKSMVVSAATYAGRGPIELILMTASMGTFLSVALKLQWFAFFGEPHGARVERPVPASMYLAMALAAAVCIVTGLVPGATLYALLPFDATYEPFTAHHFVESLQLLLATALAFWLLRARLAPKALVSLDVDRLYREPLGQLVFGTSTLLEGLGRRTQESTGSAVASAWGRLLRLQEGRGPAPVALQSLMIASAVAGVAIVLLLL